MTSNASWSSRWRKPWRIMHSRAVVGVVVAVLTGVLVELTTGAVGKLWEDNPASCPGTDCDGRNPESANCGDDAGTYEPRDHNPVALQIRHSQRCNAVWGRITAGEIGDRVTIQVTGGTLREAEISFDDDVFTRMSAVDNDRFVVTVCALPTDRPDRVGTWPEYCVKASNASPWL